MREGTGGRVISRAQGAGDLAKSCCWRFPGWLEMVNLVSELTEICYPVLRELKKVQQESQKNPPICSRAGGVIIPIIIIAMIIG